MSDREKEDCNFFPQEPPRECLDDYMFSESNRIEIKQLVSSMFCPKLYECYNIHPSKSVLLEGPPGNGKCLGKNTPILMYDGSIKMVQEVKQDDLLMGPETDKELQKINKRLAMKKNMADDLEGDIAPHQIEYYCKIHNKLELALYTGTNKFKHLTVHYYNTPDGYTFGYHTMKELEFDLKSDGWWDSYGRKYELSHMLDGNVNPIFKDEEYWERFK